MTGTDHSRISDSPAPGPVIILVNPQMGENIGASARAMLNCGVSELRLVSPRDGWPSPAAEAMSSGALERMPPVRVYTTTAEAIFDLHHVYATTARPRDMVKNVMTARGAAGDMRTRINQNQRVGILFGGERSGLVNEDIALAGTVITIPLNPGFSSLNLGQAVLLASYEWMVSGDETPPRQLVTGDSPVAEQANVVDFLKRLERELDQTRFFRTNELKPTVLRNIHAMITRAQMTEQEVNTMHGIVSALAGKISKGQ